MKLYKNLEEISCAASNFTFPCSEYLRSSFSIPDIVSIDSVEASHSFNYTKMLSYDDLVDIFQNLGLSQG